MTLVIPYVIGGAFLIVFGTLALLIRHSPNGSIRDREPVMWALSWLGLALIIERWALIFIADHWTVDASRQFSRVFFPLAGLIPLLVIVSMLMRPVWLPRVRRLRDAWRSRG